MMQVKKSVEFQKKSDVKRISATMAARITVCKQGNARAFCLAYLGRPTQEGRGHLKREGPNAGMRWMRTHNLKVFVVGLQNNHSFEINSSHR